LSRITSRFHSGPRTAHNSQDLHIREPLFAPFSLCYVKARCGNDSHRPMEKEKYNGDEESRKATEQSKEDRSAKDAEYARHTRGERRQSKTPRNQHGPGNYFAVVKVRLCKTDRPRPPVRNRSRTRRLQYRSERRRAVRTWFEPELVRCNPGKRVGPGRTEPFVAPRAGTHVRNARSWLQGWS
jgi:hypothetical protein